MSKKNKNISGVVYSTNVEFQYQFNQEAEQETLEPKHQDLRVQLDKKTKRRKSSYFNYRFYWKQYRSGKFREKT